MTEYEKKHDIRLERKDLTVLSPGEDRPSPEKKDLVVDLSGMRELNLTSLALLLTAQRSAQRENRAVWLAGVPGQVWEALYAMGLGRFFRAFPTVGEAGGPA